MHPFQVLGDPVRRRILELLGPLREVDDWLEQFRGFWAQRLDALATEVARGKRKRR